jgi:hypothetical protein
MDDHVHIIRRENGPTDIDEAFCLDTIEALQALCEATDANDNTRIALATSLLTTMIVNIDLERGTTFDAEKWFGKFKQNLEQARALAAKDVARKRN